MSKSGLTTLLHVCGLAIVMAAPVARAQSSGASTEAVAPADADDETVVIVQGMRRDRAMEAFLHGDFETAEAEFRNNMRCIRRDQLALEASVRQVISDAITASLSPTRIAGFGDNNLPQIHSLPQRPVEEIAERTCFSEEWQLYMIGLSQIQLGRFDDAKESLYRVTRLSKEDLLFDAHFRVGLLELLDGNIDSAGKRLSHLTAMQRSCTNRGTRCEVHADLDVAVGYLKRAIADARHTRRR